MQMLLNPIGELQVSRISKVLQDILFLNKIKPTKIRNLMIKKKMAKPIHLE